MNQQQHYSRSSRYRQRQGGSSWMFAFVLAAAVLFVWLTSNSLPDIVASHFIASGEANGFMPRIIYVRFMLGLIVFISLLLAYLPGLTMNSPNARINLPNRDYWLAPERRQETIARLRRSMKSAAGMMAVFLAYVHWLVVQANKIAPPHMSKPWIIGGLAVFVLSILCWSWLLIKPYRDVPRYPVKDGLR